MPRFVHALGAVLVTAAFACSSSNDGPAAPRGGLAGAFDASAEANHVPRDLMIAIAQTEGGLTMPAHRQVDPDNEVPAAGPLMLRHAAFDSLARGAALMSTSELALRTDADLALEASARVQAEVGGRNRATATDLASWSAAVEEMSGYSDQAHRAEYAHRVYALLARGGTFVGRDGESITLAAHPEIPPTLTLDLSSALRPQGIATSPADYGPAEWFPTPEANKWTSGRPNGAVDRIVIHDTEGGWDASVATLQNDSGKSVHYIVGQDGRVGQFVHESDTAWHAGNWYYNTKSVGIEHVGYYTQPYPNALYDASAALVKYLTGKYGVPKDRTHIVGHDQIPNGNVMAEDSPPCEKSPYDCEQGTSYGGAGNHRDPGDFEWCIYMVERLGGGECKCNDIWSLWNCTSDHTEAMRCADGKTIEIEHCDGPGACESMPNGTNDVCHMASPSTDAGGTSGGDAGKSGGDAGATSGDGGAPGPVPSGSSSGNGGQPGAPGDTGDPGASVGDGGGCSVAWGAPSRSPVTMLTVTALTMMLLRRRRARRA